MGDFIQCKEELMRSVDQLKHFLPSSTHGKIDELVLTIYKLDQSTITYFTWFDSEYKSAKSAGKLDEYIINTFVEKLNIHHSDLNSVPDTVKDRIKTLYGSILVC